MGILGKIFGSESLVKRAADGVYHGIDAAILTNEEKIRYHIEYLKAYEPFKLAQRLLALIVGIPYVFMCCVSGVLLALSLLGAPCEPDQLCKSAQLMHASEALFSHNTETLGTPFAIILAFYFAGGAVEGVMRTRQGKASD